jgi:hypothetical protein
VAGNTFQELTGAQTEAGIVTVSNPAAARVGSLARMNGSGTGKVGSLSPPPKAGVILSQLTRKQIREILTDPTIRLARRMVVAPVLLSGWSVEGDNEAPEEIREFIKTAFAPHEDRLLRVGLLGCMDWGWQPFEKRLKVIRDARTGLLRVIIDKFKALLHDRTEILVWKNGDFAGLHNQVNEVDAWLDTPECLVFYQDVEGQNWYGESDLVGLWPTFEKYKEVEKSAARFDRKVSGAHWLIYYPVGKTMYKGVETDNFDIAMDILRQLEANGSIAVPQHVSDLISLVNQASSEGGLRPWQIELKTADGAAMAGMLDRMRYLDALKVRAFGHPERAVLEGQYGTKAEAETHGNIATVNIELRRRDMFNIINKHAVNQIIRLNFGEEWENRVWLSPNPINDKTWEIVKSLYDRILAEPGFTVAEMERWDTRAMRKMLRIPERKEDNQPQDNPPVPGATPPGVPAPSEVQTRAAAALSRLRQGMFAF